jgi:CRP-like cAMP-binding protein
MKRKKIYHRLKKGDYFGIFAFLTDDPQELSASSSTVSHIAYINKQDFLEVIRNFPNDFVKLEIFYFI